jgi:hypothetical protein
LPDIHGKEMKLAVPDSDSRIYLQGNGNTNQHLKRPIGSGDAASTWIPKCPKSGRSHTANSG